MIEALEYQRLFFRAIAAPAKRAKTTAGMDIQRHGNCIKRSFGSSVQKMLLMRSIRNTEIPVSMRRVAQTFFVWGSACECLFRGGYTMAASAAVSRMVSTAVLEAMRLKMLCSGSGMLV